MDWFPGLITEGHGSEFCIYMRFSHYLYIKSLTSTLFRNYRQIKMDISYEPNEVNEHNPLTLLEVLKTQEEQKCLKLFYFF